jgi:hypothetical protein
MGIVLANSRLIRCLNLLIYKSSLDFNINNAIIIIMNMIYKKYGTYLKINSFLNSEIKDKRKNMENNQNAKFEYLVALIKVNNLVPVIASINSNIKHTQTIK